MELAKVKTWTSISLPLETRNRLQQLQAGLERKVGFAPSYPQIVEFLINEYLKHNPTDKVTDGHPVQPK